MMALRFCGYFPKKIALRPENYVLPNVVEIASVSDCISKGPEDWITKWKHNDLGFFNDEGLAESVVPEHDRASYDLCAYRFLDERFVQGATEHWEMPELPCEPPGNDFESLGFDAVSKSTSSFFECSPLSCNGAAQTFKANRYSLFDSLAEAIAGAIEFSKGSWEPGPYYVAEVLRRCRTLR